MRGEVLGLTAEQRVERLRYLAGKAQANVLDDVIRDKASLWCPSLTYQLKLFNGGKDPRAPHPGTPHDGELKSDCIGGQAWGGGWDRYQPERFAHVRGYEGWINTDSMRIDAGGAQRCFVRIDIPTPGDMVVFASGAGGHKVGHIGGITAFHGAEFDPKRRECWQLIEVVDVAARAGRANKMTTGLGWFGLDAWFVRCIMTP